MAKKQQPVVRAWPYLEQLPLADQARIKAIKYLGEKYVFAKPMKLERRTKPVAHFVPAPRLV